MKNDTSDRVLIWDPLVRIFHWSLLIGFFTAYFTRHSEASLHEWVGYAVLALIGFRILWGFIGSRYARFRQFVRSPEQTGLYASSVISGTQSRYQGHNPLGGWMILVLLSSVVLTCFTGWLYTTDRFWGIEWVEEVHEWFTYFCFFLVALHVSGVILASRHDHENLVASMIHGLKRKPGADDII